MKKILYFCNRCKQEIEDNPAKIIMETVDRESGDYPDKAIYPELVDMDFCKDCADFFAGLVRRHCDKGAPAVPNKEFEKAVQSMVEEKKAPEPKLAEQSKSNPILAYKIGGTNTMKHAKQIMNMLRNDAQKNNR